MKKSIALLLIIVLLLSMVACKSEKEKPDKYCWSCGEGISAAVSFCGYCGAAVQNHQSEASVTTDASANEPEVTQAPTHVHSYTQTVTAATCTKQGYTTYTCSCGDTYTDHQTAAKGHNYTQTTTLPTCTTGGYTTYTCACGHTYTGNQTAATGHHYTQKVTQPTCIEQGYTTHTCSCGDSYKSNYVAPSHRYSNYRCTECEAVDKSHAYDYLIAWVKEHGTASGEYVEFEYVSDSCTYGISYSAQGNYLYVFRMDDRTYASVALDTYYYGCTYFGDYTEYEICGYISPGTFTYNTALTHNRYTGDASALPIVAELAREEICDLLDWLDWCLINYYIGLTVKDLGFIAY